MRIGELIYEFFLIPTIRIENKYKDYFDIELCWFKWYINMRIMR